MLITVQYPEVYPGLVYQPEVGNWIDLYAAEEYHYKAGDSFRINLGVAIKLPPGHEALMVPRSSTFSKYGLIQTNSIGVIDNAYCGKDDIWQMPVLAMRDGFVPKYARVCQFKVVPSMSNVEIVPGDLPAVSRGGFGSTGT